MSILKPALQGVDGRLEKLKPRKVDVKMFVSSESIAFIWQDAAPATYAWPKVEGVLVYES